MTEPLDDARGELLACKPVSHYESRDCYHIEACPHFVAVILRAQKAEAELAALRPAPVPQCEAEPVAWRWKVSPLQLNWQYSDAPPAKFPVYNLELLYATPASRSDVDPFKLGREWCPICKHDDGQHEPTCKWAVARCDAVNVGLPKPETMLTYASILEKPQYWIDPKTGQKYQLATGEIIEAACATLRYCAALSTDPGTVAVASGPTAEDIRACARSTLIGFQHELGDSNIEFICDQISRKATMPAHPSTDGNTP